MSKLKIFLIVAVSLLLVAVATSGYVWVKIQQTISTSAVELLQEKTGILGGDSTVEAPEFIPSDETPIANTLPEEGIKIDTSAITPEQKAAAEKIGIDLDSVSITPEMVGCAEKKLGAARVQEIMDGSSPSVLESMSLLGCL